MNKADFTGYFKNIQKDKTDLNQEEVWKVAKEHLKMMLGNRIFASLFSESYIEDINNGVVQISCDTMYKREKILKDYKASVKQALKKASGYNFDIEINLRKEPTQTKRNKYEYHDLTSNGMGDLFTSAEKEKDEWDRKLAESQLNPKYLFSNFIVGKSNELAEAVAQAIVRDLGTLYNPVFFYGDTGLGKTHLMQAIGNEILKNDSKKKVVYTSIEQFLNEMVAAIKTRRNEEFRMKYRTVDLLIIDDVQFVEKYPRTQEEFFHTFNALYQLNKQIVLASDRPPKEIKNITDRLRTRFEGGMVADIQAPDYETRIAILQQMLENRNASIPNEYIEMIAKNKEKNIRELEGAVTKVISLFKLGLKPTREDIAKMLQIDIDYKRKKMTPAKVITAVAETFDVKPSEIKGNRRTAYVAQCRQVVMYILRKELELPYERIAREVNRKDHTTVLHAFDKIEKLQGQDSRFAEKVESCIRILRG